MFFLPLFFFNLFFSRKARGAVILAEVSPASLHCDGALHYDQNWKTAASIVTSPPIREGEAASLCSGLEDGTVDIISSHHAAYNSQQRALGRDNFQEIPKGITGIEERMVVLWQKTVKEGSMSKQRFVEATSAGAAKLLNIFPQKGAVVVGSDADIVIWNPNQTKTITSEEHLTKCDVNIFQDLVCSGGPEYVIFKGRMVLDQGTFRSVLSRIVKFDQIPNTKYIQKLNLHQKLNLSRIPNIFGFRKMTIVKIV